MWAKSQQRGFTIVELLIVIVVIAILAAIVTVAYSGITQRAQESGAQALANQASKAILVYSVTNDAYPADLATINLTNPGLQYSVNNTTSPKTFCVTATNGTKSYFVSDSQNVPQSGGCPGHGQGGQPAVTNLVSMPAPLTGDNGAWTQFNAAGGYTMTNNVNANGTRNSWRMTLGSAGMTGGANPGTIGYEYQGTGIQVTPGNTVYPSIYVRANKAGNYSIWCTFWNLIGSTGTCPQAVVAVAANTWTRLGGTAITVPASSDRMTIRASYTGGTSWVAGDWWEATMASTAPGAYADGNTTNWIWNGTVGKSTSTGPQQ